MTWMLVLYKMPQDSRTFVDQHAYLYQLVHSLGGGNCLRKKEAPPASLRAGLTGTYLFYYIYSTSLA